MSSVPVLKPHEVTGILVLLGFREVRQRGSHKQFRHGDGRATTVPVQGGRDLSPVLIRRIARDAGLEVDDFVSRGRH